MPVSTTRETVVLLHGIMRTSRSLRPLERALQKRGYQVLNITYPSTTKDLASQARDLYANQLDQKFWQSADRVHFVTHSMGGLLARQYLHDVRAKIASEKMGRVVMMAPPNGGSEIANLLHKLWLYRWLYGPAGQELTTMTQGQSISPVYYDLGIIAGSCGWLYPEAWLVLPGAHDGRVTVERTKLPGMKDHITLPVTHTFIMNKQSVHQQIFNFLEQGRFRHETK